MAKAKKEGDLYIASVLHVARGEEKNPVTGAKTTITKAIAAGQMVSDTDLTADEVKEFKRQGVLRYPTPAEQEAMDAAADTKDAATAADEAADAQLREQEQKIERDRLAADTKAEADKKAAALADKQAKENVAATAKTGKKK